MMVLTVLCMHVNIPSQEISLVLPAVVRLGKTKESMPMPGILE